MSRSKLTKLVSRYEEMYDRYLQLLSEDRFEEASHIGIELAEFNAELDLVETH